MSCINFVIFLAACAGFVCGGITAEFTRDPVVAAVVAVTVALTVLIALAGVVVRLLDREERKWSANPLGKKQ